MEKSQYTETQEHKDDHLYFIERLNELKSDIQGGKATEGMELLSLLAKWWQDHHDDKDGKLAKFAKSH